VYVKEAERSLQHYPARSSTALGVIQIICGLACIILGGCAIGYDSVLAPVGYGIWGGVFPIIAGAFGIASACHKTKCLLVANLVLSIIAAGMMAAPFCLAISSAAMEEDFWYYDYWNGYPLYKPYYSNRMAIDVLLVLFAAAALICAIWASGIACRFCCPCKGCWTSCCSCYGKGNMVANTRFQTVPVQANTVANAGLLPRPVQNVGQPGLVQYSGHPGFIQYPAQGGMIFYQGQPAMVQLNAQNLAHPGYLPNGMGYATMMQPPSYSIILDQPPPFSQL
jgi:hypothetical protein